MEFGNYAIERIEGVEIRIHIQPGASKTEIVGLHGEAVKIRIAAPPVGGQANAELFRFLAGQLGVPQKNVQIISGFRARQKRVLIQGRSLSEISVYLTKSTSPKNLSYPPGTAHLGSGIKNSYLLYSFLFFEESLWMAR